MSLIFKEREKQLELDVVGYQFPDMSQILDDEYDPNWLVVSINYSDGKKELNEKDPCLLSFELEDIITNIDLMLKGEETGFIGTFLEPYLLLSMTQIKGTYTVQIRFVYDTSDWKEVYVCQNMNWQELSEMNNELKRIYDMFPCRKKEKE